jgi:hypothetical protein
MKAEFGYSRRKLANGMAGAAAFVVTALAVALFAVAAGQPLWAVLPPMTAIAAFFGLVAVTYGRRYPQSGPVLTIGDDGILDRRLGPDPVPWDEITRLATVRVWGHDVLELKLTGPERFLAPPALVTRILVPVHRAMGLSPLLVSPAELDASFGDLLHAVRRFRPESAESPEGAPASSGVA